MFYVYISYICYSFWGLAIIALYFKCYKIRDWEVATGKVIEIIKNDTGDGIMYSPKIEYMHNKFGIVQFVNPVSSSFRHKIGQEIKIIYDPDVNDSALINSFISKYLLPLILFIFAIVISLIWLLKFNGYGNNSDF